jgi:hypothetical protein
LLYQYPILEPGGVLPSYANSPATCRAPLLTVGDTSLVPEDSIFPFPHLQYADEHRTVSWMM